jgi:hypothetical protein
MKGLSLRQPWLTAILHLGKRIENRTWNTSYRGEVLLHASAGVGSLTTFSDACDIIARTVDELAWVNFRDRFLGIRMLGERAVFVPGKEMVLGGIVAQARIVGVIPPCRPRPPKPTIKKTQTFKDAFAIRCSHTWHAPEQHAFELAEVRPLYFTPFKGALTLFEVPDDIARKAGVNNCAHSVPACDACVTHDTIQANST